MHSYQATNILSQSHKQLQQIFEVCKTKKHDKKPPTCLTSSPLSTSNLCLSCLLAKTSLYKCGKNTFSQKPNVCENKLPDTPSFIEM